MKYFITGCSGFIGSNLVDRLLSEGNEVVGIDNLSTGRVRFLESAQKNKKFTFINQDLKETDELPELIKGSDAVFHLSANADVRFGTSHPSKDLEQNTLVTFKVLESMRKANVKKIIFSSTGSVYGEAKVFPTPEEAPFPIQTSLYGASKSACEGLITAYSEGFEFQSYIFRFVSILGQRYSHGHVFDFYKKLMKNNNELEVLGNGKQRKSYLHIEDCIDAILIAISKEKESINIFNLGTNEYCEVNDSISYISERLSLRPKLKYTGGDRGWIGDNPFIFLDIEKIKKLGWEPKYSIREGIIDTLDYLIENQWLFDDE